MPVRASLTPWRHTRHFSYSSLNWTAAWLSVQPSSTELLIPADSAACREAVSAASAWHCPAIVFSVARSTLIVPPQTRAPPGTANGRGQGGAGGSAVHKPDRCPQMPFGHSAGRVGGG